MKKLIVLLLSFIICSTVLLTSVVAEDNVGENLKTEADATMSFPEYDHLHK